jgi:hypothetical protein
MDTLQASLSIQHRNTFPHRVNSHSTKPVAERATCFYSCITRRITMRFTLGLLLGYCMRGKKRLLIATLIAIVIVCFIVLPAIALSQLAISVRRERLSRPPQTSVPTLIGLDCRTAQVKVRDANANIRVLAYRHDLGLEPGIIVARTPLTGERVDFGTVIGVTMSRKILSRVPAHVSRVRFITMPFT